jgi:hypothetical protein
LHTLGVSTDKKKKEREREREKKESVIVLHRQTG